VALAALALGGVALAEGLQGSTKLAARYISCISGTSVATAKVDTYDIEANGRTPQQACSPVMPWPADKLVACDSARFGVTVFEASGRSGQCQSLGMSVLPASYAAANEHVHELILALDRLNRARGCIPPAALARQVDAVLAHLGFTGWRAQIQAGQAPFSGGPCGQFPPSGKAVSDPSGSLDSQHDVVMIDRGPSRSMSAVAGTIGYRLLVASGRRCYTLASIQAYARRALAAHGVPALFAVNREDIGEEYGVGRQARYDRGCAIIINVGVAPNGRTVDVLINQRSAPKLPGTEGMHAPGVYR